MGMRKRMPVTMFQRPPKIKLAVRSTWPVRTKDNRIGKKVPRSPSDPLNSPRVKLDLKVLRRSLTLPLIAAP